MPPSLALGLGFICALVLLRLDTPSGRRRVSAALWIPTLWLLIVGSRPVSQWFGPGNSVSQADLSPAEAYSEGSPLDRNIFLILIIAGLIALIRRRIKVWELMRQNPWLLLFVAFAALSISWSEFPMVAFKRWIKLAGNIVMGTLIATELHSTEAFRTVLARCTYILVPLSVVLIKYFPDFGRKFNPFTGSMQLTGVGSHKNELGALCVVVGLFLVWGWTMVREEESAAERRWRLLAHAVCGVMVVWLLIQADGATSTVTAIVGAAMLLILNRWRGRQMRWLTPVVTGFIAVMALVYFSGFIETLILALGEDLTLTGRTELWAEVLAAKTNPLLGTGFESFWLGSVAEELWLKYWWHPNQAHNGFIETYLNLGMIGLTLLLGYIVQLYSASVTKMRTTEFDRGRFAFTFLVIVILFNMTEAYFHGLSLVWVMLLLCSLTYPAQAAETQPQPVTVARSLARHRFRRTPAPTGTTVPAVRGRSAVGAFSRRRVTTR
jgi:O-antigen ligase